MQFQNKAFEMLEKVINDLSESSEVDMKPYKEGNKFICQIIPKTKK